MKTRLFHRLAAAVGICLLSATLAAAQDPPPAPVVTVESLTAAGHNLGVNLLWHPGSGVLPGDAILEVADTNGADVTAVSFVPQWGPQTIWLPGGLAPLPSDPPGEPLRRNLELVGGPYEEVLISTDLALQGTMGPVLLQERRIRKQEKKWCYLHLISIKCVETEDSGALGEMDETFITVNGVNIWEMDMENGQVEVIDQWFCLGPSPGMSLPQIVTILDADDPPVDPHDRLANLKVTGQNPTSGVITRHFYKDDAHYILVFEIRCFRKQVYPC